MTVPSDSELLDANLKAEAARQRIAEAQAEIAAAAKLEAAVNEVKAAERERRQEQYDRLVMPTLDRLTNEISDQEVDVRKAFAEALERSELGQAFIRLREILWGRFHVSSMAAAHAADARLRLPLPELHPDRVLGDALKYLDDIASENISRQARTWATVRTAYIQGESNAVVPDLMAVEADSGSEALPPVPGETPDVAATVDAKTDAATSQPKKRARST